MTLRNELGPSGRWTDTLHQLHSGLLGLTVIGPPNWAIFCERSRSILRSVQGGVAGESEGPSIGCCTRRGAQVVWAGDADLNSARSPTSGCSGRLTVAAEPVVMAHTPNKDGDLTVIAQHHPLLLL